MANSVEHLQAMRDQLQSILEHLPRFGTNVEGLPIIDSLESDNDNDDVEDSSTSEYSSPNGSRERGDASRERNTLRHPHTSIPGFRAFREIIRNDIEQIDKFLARHAQHRTTVSASAFSTNAPYLIAVWNDLVRAEQPVVAVDKSFPVRVEERRMSNSKPALPPKTFSRRGMLVTKVDIVADNGRHWIRVNTVRNSRLLAELRELDSYLTDSDSEDNDHPGGTSSHKAKPAPHELDNTLLQMGKQLVAASRATVAEYGGKVLPPKVTLHLTRLLLDKQYLSQLESLGLKIIGSRERSITSKRSEMDPRIPQTVRELLQMGIEVVLGEYESLIPLELFVFSASHQPRPVPSRQINLDLSVLIALISDITHAPLPKSEEEAYARYIPTPAERARSHKRRQQQKELAARAKAHNRLHNFFGRSQNKTKDTGKAGLRESSDNSESDDEGESVHSRALANQVLREIDQTLLGEIASRLRHGPGTAPGSYQPVEFWTSREVRERCLRIVDKIGGPAEKRRAAALFSDPSTRTEPPFGIRHSSPAEAVAAYWRGSRHPQNFVPGLVPLRIFDDADDKRPAKSVSGLTENSFWTSLEYVCTRLLSEGSTHHPRALAALSDSSAQSGPSHAQPTHGRDGHNHALADEIERAAVTRSNPRLTAHTVGTLYRGVRRRWTTLTANRTSVRELLKESAKAINSHVSFGLSLSQKISGLSLNNDATEVAAIWVVEPRSLAETMRGDFVGA